MAINKVRIQAGISLFIVSFVTQNVVGDISEDNSITLAQLARNCEVMKCMEYIIDSAKLPESEKKRLGEYCRENIKKAEADSAKILATNEPPSEKIKDIELAEVMMQFVDMFKIDDETFQSLRTGLESPRGRTRWQAANLSAFRKRYSTIGEVSESYKKCIDQIVSEMIDLSKNLPTDQFKSDDDRKAFVEELNRKSAAWEKLFAEPTKDEDDHLRSIFRNCMQRLLDRYKQ